jgi:hypothetical protein
MNKFKKGDKVDYFGFYLPKYLESKSGFFTCKKTSYKSGNNELVEIKENNFTFDCNYLKKHE